MSDIIRITFIAKNNGSTQLKSGTLAKFFDIDKWVTDVLTGYINSLSCYPYPSSYCEYLELYEDYSEGITIFYSLNDDVYVYELLVDLFWPNLNRIPNEVANEFDESNEENEIKSTLYESNIIVDKPESTETEVSGSYCNIM